MANKYMLMAFKMISLLSANRLNSQVYWFFKVLICSGLKIIIWMWRFVIWQTVWPQELCVYFQST